MADIGTGTIAVEPDTRRVETALRILAKHATACADELALARATDPDGALEEPADG